jgi:hypothetical protein
MINADRFESAVCLHRPRHGSTQTSRITVTLK